MYFSSHLVHIISVYMILLASPNESVVKRAYMQNFNVLLNLYKLHPLQMSNIYKDFYNNSVRNKIRNKPPANTDAFDLHDEKLSQRTDNNLKIIEDIIHAKHNAEEDMGTPSYDINNVDTEKFMGEFLGGEGKRIDHEDFPSMYEHMDSNELNDNLSGTTNTVSTTQFYEKLSSAAQTHSPTPTQASTITTIDDFDLLEIKHTNFMRNNQVLNKHSRSSEKGIIVFR